MDSMTQNAVQGKPDHRLEIVFNPGKYNGSRPWYGVRYNGRSHEILTQRFNNPVDVADALLDADDQLPLWTPHYLADSLRCAWEMRGADKYRAEIGIEWCVNEYELQGWLGAQKADVQRRPSWFFEMAGAA